jgi:ribosome maturation factor RimP
MDNWRKHAVVGLVVCLLHLSLTDVGLAVPETKSPDPNLARQQVGQLGVGANVKIDLASGKKLKGSIQTVEETGFILASGNAGSPTRVSYDEISQLKGVKVTYSAKGEPDAAETKRVAAGLGVGHHIMVKTAGGNEYHGKIMAIDTDRFTMLPDHTNGPVRIAYNDVRQMGPNPSRGTWITLGFLVGVVVVVVVLVVWFRGRVS